MTTDNTALRFHDFLAAIAGHARGHASAIYIVWPEFVTKHIPANDHLDPIQTFTLAGKTVQLVRDALKTCPRSEAYQWADEKLATVAAMFRMETMGEQWGYYTNALNEGTLTAVQMVASLFKTESVLLTPSIEDLSNIRSLLDDLAEEIQDADISPVEHARLMVRVRDLIIAVNNAHHFGAADLTQTVINTMAEMAVEDHQAQPTSTVQHLRGRIRETVSLIADLAQIGGFAFSLALTPGAAEPPALPAGQQVTNNITINGDVDDLNVTVDEDDIQDAEIVGEKQP